jgi:RNA polymerase sigma-70 factor (ECF subfamily)
MWLTGSAKNHTHGTKAVSAAQAAETIGVCARQAETANSGGYVSNSLKMKQSRKVAPDAKFAMPESGAADSKAAGSSAAILAPYIAHIPAARRYLARRASLCDIDDIIQDCLMRIIVAKPEGRVQYPKSYLIMVARAVLVDRLRQDTRTLRKNHCEMTEIYHPVDMITPCRILIGRQDVSRLTANLNALPARTRDMVLAVRLEGLSFKATAEKFGVCVSTVEKQVSRALAQIAEIG